MHEQTNFRLPPGINKLNRVYNQFLIKKFHYSNTLVQLLPKEKYTDINKNVKCNVVFIIICNLIVKRTKR